MREAFVSSTEDAFRQEIVVGGHHLTGDEPVEAGGTDAGPSPHELLLAALGSCTSMTVRAYARRKGWDLRHVEVRITGERVGEVFQMHRRIQLEGTLDAEQRTRLLEIAGRCPVHRTLTGEVQIESALDAPVPDPQ